MVYHLKWLTRGFEHLIAWILLTFTVWIFGIPTNMSAEDSTVSDIDRIVEEMDCEDRDPLTKEIILHKPTPHPLISTERYEHLKHINWQIELVIRSHYRFKHLHPKSSSPK